MSTPTETVEGYEPYEFDPRYYIHTAKNNITSFGHVIAEIVSNSDEAITKRAKRDDEPDVGVIHIHYDPASMDLLVTDDGIGMATAEMRKRLKKIGAEAMEEARRAFFHRGVREVFIAMGKSVVETIAMKDGSAVYTRAEFHPTDGMKIAVSDEPVNAELREQTGISGTGTRLTIPLRPLASSKPSQYTFPKLSEQIENCVQVRPVLMDPNREILFEFGDAPARAIRFAYPEGDALVNATDVEMDGMSGTLWAGATEEPIKGGGMSRQTRRFGILVRGERAAYEVSLGTKLQGYASHKQLFGELRLDGIEKAQRDADDAADDDAQLIYKADRSGLNPDHPLVESIYAFLDEKLGPLLAGLETKERKKKIGADVQRQLHELARLINDAVKLEDFGDIDSPDGKPKKDKPKKDGGEPPGPPEKHPPVVEDGIAFAHGRIFMPAGKERTVKVWFDTAKISVGSAVEIESDPDGAVRAAKLSANTVPEPPDHGIAELSLTLKADEAEGRHEVVVRSEAYKATLVVYVRYPRATGFIRDIVPVEEDWESGAAVYDPQTGRVKVYVGRPEFVNLAGHAKKEKLDDPFKYLPYRTLTVESVREAALARLRSGARKFCSTNCLKRSGKSRTRCRT